MDFQLAPLLAAPWHVQIHAFSALSALLLGTIQFIAPKGTLPHRTVGTIWVLLMIAVTVSSAFIVYEREPGESFLAHFSPIHLLTILTAVGLITGIKHLVLGGKGLKKHAHSFIAMFIGGLLIAGFFAFMPGRIMHAVIFGGEAQSLKYLSPPSWYFLPKKNDTAPGD